MLVFAYTSILITFVQVFFITPSTTFLSIEQACNSHLSKYLSSQAISLSTMRPPNVLVPHQLYCTLTRLLNSVHSTSKLSGLKQLSQYQSGCWLIYLIMHILRSHRDEVSVIAKENLLHFHLLFDKIVCPTYLWRTIRYYVV